MFITNLRLGACRDWKRFVVVFFNDSYNNTGLEFGKLLEKHHITLYTYKIEYVSIVCVYEIVMRFGFFNIRPGECRQKDPRKLLWYFQTLPSGTFIGDIPNKYKVYMGLIKGTIPRVPPSSL